MGKEAVGINNEYSKLEIQDVMNYIEKVYELPKYYLNDKLADYKSLVWYYMGY